jgi:hypothetical protein
MNNDRKLVSLSILSNGGGSISDNNKNWWVGAPGIVPAARYVRDRFTAFIEHLRLMA